MLRPHHILSYVLSPYQLCEGSRTGVTSTAPDDGLDGDLDRFKWRRPCRSARQPANLDVEDV